MATGSQYMSGDYRAQITTPDGLGIRTPAIFARINRNAHPKHQSGTFTH